jgi:hypothetical protein
VAKAVDGRGIALGGGQSVPLVGLAQILGLLFANMEAIAESALGLGEALLGGEPQPGKGLGQVAILQGYVQAEVGLWKAGLGRQPKEADALGEIAGSGLIFQQGYGPFEIYPGAGFGVFRQFILARVFNEKCF